MRLPTRTAEQNAMLHKGADRIRQHPKAYNQGSWFNSPSKAAWLASLLNPDCGTTACMCGNLGLANPELNAWRQPEGHYREVFDSESVSQQLGMTYAEHLAMFGGTAELWPEPYRQRWLEGYIHESPEEMAKAAADFLDDFADGLIWWDNEALGWVTLEEYCTARDELRDKSGVKEHDDAE